MVDQIIVAAVDEGAAALASSDSKPGARIVFNGRR